MQWQLGEKERDATSKGRAKVVGNHLAKIQVQMFGHCFEKSKKCTEICGDSGKVTQRVSLVIA